MPESKKQKQIRMAFARGVKKAKSESFNAGWDAAMRQRDKADAKLLKGLGLALPIPEDKLAPEAQERKEPSPVPEYQHYDPPNRRLMTAFLN